MTTTTPTHERSVDAASAEDAPGHARAVEGLVVPRGLHEALMNEVVVDPRAEVALTLDIEGQVRLWTSLDPSEVQPPVALPVQEPAWMSVAQAEDGLVVGFIDTAGGARVARVEVGERGARVVPLFEVPATDPLFELHVLDGGERIVALGIDHRVRLYDRGGAEVSALEPMGFVPWQLRVQQVPGRAPAIVAVLTGPTRIQPIALEDDRLALGGPAREVVIDQGPNRNDLSLAPDGRTVIAMRRPRARGRRVTLELVDLETDERRLLAAKLDSRERPRLHVFDDGRVLLETGTGFGHWLELSHAVPWTVGTSREETEALEAAPSLRVRLPASTEPRRAHTTVVGRVRVVPNARTLVVDPVDEDRHVALEAVPMRPVAVAMSADGDRVAWSTDDGIVIEPAEPDGTSVRTVAPAAGTAVELAFVGRGRLLTMDARGQAAIIGADGGVVSKTRLEAGWGMQRAGFRHGATAAEGSLALLPQRPQDPIRVVDVGDGAFAEPRDVPRWQRTQWPQMGARERDARAVLEALGFDALSAGAVGALVEGPDGRHFVAARGGRPTLYWVSGDETESVVLRDGGVERLVPDPDGQRVAVVQHSVQSSERRGVDDDIVSVYDVATRARLWSRVVRDLSDLDWSHDGQRVAVAAADGGRVIDAGTGARLLWRRDLGLRASTRPDAGE